MNHARTALIAVVGFGLLMALIALVLINFRPATAVAVYLPDSPQVLYGIWNTRTLSEDNLHGAYSGRVEFGPDYYQVENDLVVQPIRLDNIQYQQQGDHISLWTRGNQATPTRIRMLSEDRATIEFPSKTASVLYMYRATD